MKVLKKVLLINWFYFSKQVIELKDINFITGKTGVGKSTIIDALQVVLLGEGGNTPFNKAANEKSIRTLSGYLHTDLDADNIYSRKGKDFSSHIACEFYDDNKSEYFVSGFVSDCSKDGTEKYNYYLYTGRIPENDFVIDRKPMCIHDMRKFIKDTSGLRGEMFDSNKAYKNAFLARTGIGTEKAMSMLKKAVSFEPITDIQKFITENVCDLPNRPDIDKMQENIRYYKQQEKIAELQKAKINKLSSIEKAYKLKCEAENNYRLNDFIRNYAEKEKLESDLSRKEKLCDNLKLQIADKEKEIKYLTNRKTQKTEEKEKIIVDIESNEKNIKRESLQKEKISLEDKKQNLINVLQNEIGNINKEAIRINKICEFIEDNSENDSLKNVLEDSYNLKKSFLPFDKFELGMWKYDMSVFETAKNCCKKFFDNYGNIVYKLSAIVDEKKKQCRTYEEKIENLKKNKKDYPKELLTFKIYLEEKLSQLYGEKINSFILADTLEICSGEEKWRGAVEGYLNNQKFYILVEPKYYLDALKISDAVKNNYNKFSVGLVDIFKIREKEIKNPLPNSLALKITTHNDLAQTYINYLLGKVICCERLDELRNNRISITSEGMLYQGYVSRPILKSKMEDYFIGQNSIKYRIDNLKNKLEQEQEYLNFNEPILDAINRQKEPSILFDDYFLSQVEIHKAEYSEMMKIGDRLDEIFDELEPLNLFWKEDLLPKLEGIKQEIDGIERKTASLNNDLGSLRNKLESTENSRPETIEAIHKLTQYIGTYFSDYYIENIGLPGLNEKKIAVGKLQNIIEKSKVEKDVLLSEMDNTKNNLFNERKEYINSYQAFRLSYDSMDNSDFDLEKKKLEEIELPLYIEKIKKAKNSAMEQFKNDFLARLKSSIDQVKRQVKELNRALKNAEFGSDKYEFKVERNPDYAQYYDMIMSDLLMEGESLFAAPFQEKYGVCVQELFNKIVIADDEKVNSRMQSELQKNIELFTDFRTYLKFDLETTDKNGNKQLLSKTLRTKSGGETQTPFYIAILASFAQLYHVNDKGMYGNTARLVIFDEAFNKMDNDRVIESIKLLRKMGLQAIISTPPDKVSDISPEADATFVVLKNDYRMNVLPWSKEMEYA